MTNKNNSLKCIPKTPEQALEVINTNIGEFYSFVRYLTLGQNSNDIAHSAYIDISTNIETYNCQTPLSVWIAKIIISNKTLFYRKNRKSKRFRGTQEPGLNNSNDPQSQAEVNELVQKIGERLTSIQKVILDELVKENYTRDGLSYRLSELGHPLSKGVLDYEIKCLKTTIQDLVGK